LKNNPAHRLLRAILKVQSAHPLLVLLAALALAAFSVHYTIRNLEFQTSQNDLIYPDNRLMRLSERLAQFEDLDSFVVVIQSPDRHRSLQFLQDLAARLEKDKISYQQIFFRVDPRQFRPWELLYLEKKDLYTLSDNLREHHEFLENLRKSPGLVNFFEQINHEMTSKMVGELFTGYLEEKRPGTPQRPVDLDFLIRVLREMKWHIDSDGRFVSPWESLLTKESWGDASQEGYFWTRNKRYLLLFVNPTKNAGFTGTWQSLTALRRAIAETRPHFPGVKVGVTGQEALNADQMGTAFKDMSVATVVSLLVVAMLLVFFWRGIRRPLLEITRLSIDMALTFGATTLFVGHLNILSVIFAPLILGLGIDYGAHWFARYMEEEKRGFTSKREAVWKILEKLGPGLLLAGLNASLSFFPLVLTGFKGLVELGIICTMGMVITTLTSLCLLPALVLLFDKPRQAAPSSPLPAPIKPLFHLARPRVLTILALSGMGLVFGVWGGSKVRFDLNMLKLQSPKVESVVWEKKLLEGSDISSMAGEVVARSLEEVRQKTKALALLPTVSKVQSVDDLFPKDQEDKIAMLRKLRPLLGGVKPFPTTSSSVSPEALEEILGRIRFKMLDSSSAQWGANKPLQKQMIEVRTLIDQLQQRLHSKNKVRIRKALDTFQTDLMHDLNDKLDILRTNVSTRPMVLSDLPPNLLRRFVSRNGLYLIRAFPSEDIWEPAFLGRFVADLTSVDPDAIGDPITLYVFTQAFRNGCIKAAVYAVVFIFIFLLLTFRSIKATLLVLVPLLVGTIWTLGFMHLFGINLNLANSLFLPLVVGAGVEYGIIIIYRWRQREKDKGGVVLPFNTAMGVILAGLTTTVGFCSLCVSSHQGIFSLGLLTTIGSLCISAASIIFLPAFLHYLSAGKPPDPDSAP
jgi:hypothetical protein